LTRGHLKKNSKKFKKTTKWHVAHSCVDTCTFKKI